MNCVKHFENEADLGPNDIAFTERVLRERIEHLLPFLVERRVSMRFEQGADAASLDAMIQQFKDRLASSDRILQIDIPVAMYETMMPMGFTQQPSPLQTALAEKYQCNVFFDDGFGGLVDNPAITADDIPDTDFTLYGQAVTVTRIGGDMIFECAR